jgi:lipid II:glycine glycyltransferase (peptidoglycan interpeptide bridge formation enzyme)
LLVFVPMSRAKLKSPVALEGHAVSAVSVVQQTELSSAVSAEWDRLVDNLPGTDVTQHVAWGRVRQMAGFESSFLLAYRGSSLVGGAQLFRRRLPLVGGIGYLPYGPLIFSLAQRDHVRAALCAALRDLPALGLRALFIQPPDGGEEISDELLALGFRHSVAGIAPRSTLRIDLTRSDGELYGALGKKLRRWTRRWPEHGVHVRQGDQADLPALARLLEQTAARQGFEPLSLPYLRRLYSELAPTGHGRLFVAEINGKPVAASLMTACGGVLKSRISGFDCCRSTAELRAPAAVRWTAIKWAKANGFRYFDFGGLSERATNELLSGNPVNLAALPGPDQFKVSFGGQAYRYPPPVELIGSAILRRAYHLSKRMPSAHRVQALLRTAFRGGSGTR